MSEAELEGSPVRAWGAALLGWLVPGAGHVSLGRAWRGLLLGLAVWLMFLSGVWMGGHLHGLLETGAGLLSSVFGLCDLGNGLLYWGARGADIAVREQASRPTAEYGNVFLMVSGLLNYLLALDAYDIGVGRRA